MTQLSPSLKINTNLLLTKLGLGSNVLYACFLFLSAFVAVAVTALQGTNFWSSNFSNCYIILAISVPYTKFIWSVWNVEKLCILKISICKFRGLTTTIRMLNLTSAMTFNLTRMIGAIIAIYPVSNFLGSIRIENFTALVNKCL